MKTILHFLLMILPLTGIGQQLLVTRVELNGGEVIFYYNLADTVPGRTFTVNLYASRDNYVSPLTALTGDQGIEVRAGNDKKVSWNALQELGSAFDGKISVEIRARVYVPFIQFENFDKVKRGKPKEVTWRGGAKQSTLNFELYNKKDEKVTTISNISAAAGYTSLYIPTHVKTGKGYRFKIVDSRNKDQIVYTGRFVVKRKVPLVLWLLPAVAAGAAVTLVGESGGGGAGEITDPPDAPK